MPEALLPCPPTGAPTAPTGAPTAPGRLKEACAQVRSVRMSRTIDADYAHSAWSVDICLILTTLQSHCNCPVVFNGAYGSALAMHRVRLCCL